MCRAALCFRTETPGGGDGDGKTGDTGSGDGDGDPTFITAGASVIPWAFACAMYDFQQPESAAVVETALRPILITRQQSRRKPGSTDDAESGPDDVAEAAESDGVEIDGEGGEG